MLCVLTQGKLLTKNYMMIRTYTELSRVSSFEDRYEYLRLHGSVGHQTFGSDRYINQRFYRSVEWQNIRSYVIVRDESCDLGVRGYEIHDRLYIHHMNPMTLNELIHGDRSVIDPEFLITTTHRTHNAIHYGDRSLLFKPYVPRRPNDTKLW